MKPKLIHQQAMDFSFRANQALEQGVHETAFELFTKAAELESQAAEFYFDKPELEPTRSILIRSAAFLNIKAGLIDNAKKFIFFGLLNSKDELIKSQLNSALEIAVSLGQTYSNTASREFSYLNILRRRSIHYVLEPSSPAEGHSVSLQAIKDFTTDYLKSLKAFAIAKFRQLSGFGEQDEHSYNIDIEKIVNPLVTSSAYGSFKFSIANDFLPRDGEEKEVVKLKTNVITNYHTDIFINPLTDDDIQKIKTEFSADEVNEIFRPLTKIKSNNAPYKVGYFDSHDFNKKFASNIVNKQRRKLLTIKAISEDDIGELESLITHRRSSPDGRIHQTTIFRQQMKSAELNLKTNLIEPSDELPIVLNEEIVLDLTFNSSTGFTFSYPDFKVENTDIDYHKALNGFYRNFYIKLKGLANVDTRSDEQQRDWDAVTKLLGNPDQLRE